MSRKEIDKVIEHLEEQRNIYYELSVIFGDENKFPKGVVIGLDIAIKTLKAQQNVKKTKLL